MEYLSFGPLLSRCRLHYLEQCAGLRRVLILGDGDGRFAARLLAHAPQAHVTAVDASPAMLAELRRRAAASAPDAADRLTIINADLRTFTPAGWFDGVTTHFSLDCLTSEECEALVGRVVPHLAPGGSWLVSEFAVPPERWRGAAARLLIAFLYFAFRQLTGLRVRELPEHAVALRSSGFRKQRAWQSLGGILIAELWTLADDGDRGSADLF